ncbi:MAG: tetratricopeptide repeat protein [Candidatus Krumholzibacteria bacterium]|nr:tetratricopeptide repeat protein [Candidatus Krumholzibacteria bacterium]
MATARSRASTRGGAPGAGLARIALIVFALALAARLVYLGEIAKSPAFHVPIIDSASYDQHARLLVEKGIFYQRFFWQGFFYPFYLAVVYFFTGGSMLCARLIQILLGSLLCVLVYRLGARLFDRRTGAVAGAIAALYGPLIFYDAELLDTGFSAVWAVVLVPLVLSARNAKGVGIAALVGVCGGLSVVTRATFLPYFVVACGWLLFSWRRLPVRPALVAARGGLMLAGFLAVTMPVAQLSYRATGDFSFLSESGPINLCIGNNPERDRTIMIRPGAEWRELTRMPTVRGSLSDSEDRDVFTRLFLDYVKTEPADFAAGLVRKSVQFASSRELPRNEDMYVARKYSRLLSVLTWKAGAFGFPFGLLLPLALAGIVRHAKRIPFPVYGFLLLYPAAIIGVFVSGRYRIPVVPILAVPAAAGALYSVDLVRSRRWPRAAAIAGAVCAVAAATSVAGPFAVEKFDYEAEMHTIVGFELMKQNRAREALEEFSATLRLEPGDADAHKYIGIIMSGERRHDEAEAHLRKALETKPDSYLIRYYLGITLLNRGKRDEAVRCLREARAGAAAAREEQLLKEIDRALGSLAGTQQ